MPRAATTAEKKGPVAEMATALMGLAARLAVTTGQDVLVSTETKMAKGRGLSARDSLGTTTMREGLSDRATTRVITVARGGLSDRATTRVIMVARGGLSDHATMMMRTEAREEASDRATTMMRTGAREEASDRATMMMRTVVRGGLSDRATTMMRTGARGEASDRVSTMGTEDVMEIIVALTTGAATTGATNASLRKHSTWTRTSLTLKTSSRRMA